MTIRKIAFPVLSTLLFLAACKAVQITAVREDSKMAAQRAKEIREKTPIKIANGLKIDLWASDSLAPDPIAMATDDYGRMYLTRSNRMKNSEFDIRGHRDWMTASISLQTVEERRAFLRKTFAPELSEKNAWLKDLNFDGVHDWKDLAVEKDEIWRIEDTDKDGRADVSTRVFSEFNEEVTDIAAGLLVRRNDMFLTQAPYVWRIEDKNGDGIFDKKDKMTAISAGYGVHIGFSGHNLSGITEGPDGRIYWNIGDIGANITATDGKKYDNANSGMIGRSNPDGSDFEIFATGLRNTHEFVFDDYGNLISSDNDGDHPTERERLVHVVEGSDAGWRSNWQYGKYTDPKNNKYKVWMDEKLSVPRWEGQAAYIIPPIQNFKNGPTGMLYNPGTALGSAWKNKFFLVEFIGMPSNSHIWSFGLKPQGASFELDGETDVVSGILPTGIQFGADGALYAADWLNGWDTKDKGRVWKIDVTADKEDLKAQRVETERLIQLNYDKQTVDKLYALLFYGDRRVRQKAQFELVRRGNKGVPLLKKATEQTDNQLARVHGIWGLGQILRGGKNDVLTTVEALLKDKDEEIVVQAMKVLGDNDVKRVGETLIGKLTSSNPRIQFFAAEALGQLVETKAVQPLLDLVKRNNDADVYIRHAAVLALSRILKGLDSEPIVSLASSDNKALKTAAVLVLRRLKSEKITVFLNDKDEYIATEAARAINDDHSIPAALPALAGVLGQKKFQSEPLMRRAINAALRVGGEREMDLLLAYSQRSDISDALRSEALATLGTWADPSVLDRVDGRFRGDVHRDPTAIRAKIKPLMGSFLQSKNNETLMAVAGMLGNLGITDANESLAKMFLESKESKVRVAILPVLNQLKFKGLDALIKTGMEDKDDAIRTAALALLDDSNVNNDNLPTIVKAIFSKGSVREQQQLLTVMSKLQRDKTTVVLGRLIEDMKNKKLSPNLGLELAEAVEANQSPELKAQLSALKRDASPLEAFAESLNGGSRQTGREIFMYNSTAQCTRCHAIGTEGGQVGPELSSIGKNLNREELLEALVDPSKRLAPGFGTVTLKLKEGQEVTGILAKETAEALTLKTSDAEPLVVPLARIAKRENMPSSMPNMGESLSKREIRDLVEYLTSLKR
jgi:quinoprotein glucose dehydrogenase